MRALPMAVILAVGFTFCVSEGQSPPVPTLALVGARIYSSPNAAPLDNGVVIVRDGKIAQIGPRQSIRLQAGATIIDCTGTVMTAGFQNSHVHFTEQKWTEAAQQPGSKLAEQLQAMLTRYGFTTVVDTGSFLPDTVALRRRIESHEFVGPRILTAGLPAYPPDGVPYYVKDGALADLLKLLPQPSTSKQAIDFVRQNIRRGADVIKLFTGSWVTRQMILPMPDDVASAAVAEAHRRGKLVFTHPSNLAGLEVALRARVDVLAHAVEDTRGLTADHLRRMKAQNMALIPTLHLFGGDNNIREIRAQVRDYQRTGGDVLFGTDVGYLPGYDPTDEFVQMSSAELTWREILASLTTKPASRFGESSRRGRVALGFEADLVVLARDPATDVRAFADVAQVIRGGQIIYSRSSPLRIGNNVPSGR